MVKLICICLALVTYAVAETCDIESVHQCMKNGLGTPPPKAKDGEEMKAKFEKCFTDAACKLQTPKEGDKPKFEAAQQCRKAVMDKIRSDVEKCVQKTNADFKFPAEEHKSFSFIEKLILERQEHPAFKEHFGKGKGKGKGKNSLFDKLLNESCPNAAAQTIVKTCLQALKPSGTPPPKQAGGSSGKKKAFCQKKTECFSKLSATCRKQMEDTKTALCQCARDVITPQAAQLQTSLEACEPAEEEKRQGSSEKSTIKPPTPGEFLIKKFCTKDKC